MQASSLLLRRQRDRCAGHPVASRCPRPVPTPPRPQASAAQLLSWSPGGFAQGRTMCSGAARLPTRLSTAFAQWLGEWAAPLRHTALPGIRVLGSQRLTGVWGLLQLGYKALGELSLPMPSPSFAEVPWARRSRAGEGGVLRAGHLLVTSALLPHPTQPLQTRRSPFHRWKN